MIGQSLLVINFKFFLSLLVISLSQIVIIKKGGQVVMNVGTRIANLRNSAHMSQFQLAKVLKIGTSTLGMYETGKREPSPKVLKRIADYFDVSTDYLLGRDNAKHKSNDLSLDEAVNSVMSFNGRPITEHDRQMMKSLWKSYLENKE